MTPLAIIITVFVISSISSGIFCGIVAAEKNRSAGIWFVAGLFFPLLALIAVAGLPAINPQNIRACVFCAELISLKASVCPCCHNTLEPVKYCSAEWCWTQYLEPGDAILIPCLEENCDEEHAFCKDHARQRKDGLLMESEIRHN